jgi:hypothetical protein
MNNWTEHKIKKLNEWTHISKIYSTCHSKAQEYYYKQFNYITITVIICGALATVLEGANLLLSRPSIGIGIVVIILTSSVSGLNLWLNSKNPAETASAHESMSKGYNRIILKIESELVNDEQERENGVKFIAEIRDNLTDLSAGSKSIPLKIWDAVNKEVGSVTFHKKSIKLHTPQEENKPVTVSESEINMIFDPAALKVAELLEQYQTARYRSAY